MYPKLSAGNTTWYMDFLHKYRVTVIETDTNFDRYNYGVTMHGMTASVVGQIASTVTLEMDMRSLQHLAEKDEHNDRMLADELEESVIRESCPAVKAAYEQYQMLLKLAK